MPLDIKTIPELDGVEAQEVPLIATTIRDDIQPRTMTSEDAVRRYKDALRQDRKTLPAVLLADLSGSNRPLPKDKTEWRWRDPLVVVDGWHRFRAHQELRSETIMAKVIRCTEERARWLAALANMNHGLPLKRGDQRRVFRRYIVASENKNSDGSLKSYRDIHGDLGGMRSVATLHGWMQKDFPAIAAEMAKRDGAIEEEPPKESKVSFAQRQMQDYATGLVRVARMALKEDKEDIRSDVLGHAWFVVAGLGAILDLDPRGVLGAAEAEWKAAEDLTEGDMMSL